MQLIGMAIRKRWLTTDELKAEALTAIRRGLSCGDERAEQAAIRNLLAMEAQNQKDEHKIVDVRIHERNAALDAIAAELGVEVGIVEHAERSRTGGNLSVEVDARTGVDD